MDYQDFCIEQIYNVLSLGLTNEQLDSVSYKYALKSGLIRLYSETYKLDNKEFKFWDLDFSSKSLKGRKVWSNLLCSEKAYCLCDKIENKVICFKDNKPYYEHLMPASFTYKTLLELNGKHPSKEQIKTILDKSKLLILTNEEVEFLDRKPYNVFNSEDEVLLKKWYKSSKISKNEYDDAIDSMKNKAGYTNTSSNGTSYARIAHLMNLGVEFKCGLYPLLSGIDLVIEYLKSNCHTIL